MTDVTSDMSVVRCITCTAPVNIAVVKYWGKRNEELILPINGSISITLDQQHLRAKTSVAASEKFECDRMWLNGIEQSMENARLQNVLKLIRSRARPTELEPSLHKYKVHIRSENNFPTAAGLASSAAGYAALVFALSKLFHVQGDVSDIARVGSGSACRSVYGGFVEWIVGSADDGSDSIARQIVPESHWPELRTLILVVNVGRKHTGSTEGMQTSVVTSELLRHRASHVVPGTLARITSAILDRDFHAFAELTMKDSNQMHAVCLDTYPPISYLRDRSHDVIRLVHAVNRHHGVNKVAYTFDAGPNACLYLLEDTVPLMLALVQHYFPPAKNCQQFITGLQAELASLTEELLQAIPLEPTVGAIQFVIHTKVGCGPQIVADSLFDTSDLQH